MSARGFTLLEVLVGGAIGLLAIGMMLAVFMSQTGTFAKLDLAREANANGRDAAMEMQASLKRSVFGIEPNLAFDFTCPVGANCHDRVNAADEITFYSRNPSYLWTPQNSALGCNTAGGCFGGGNIWPITGTTSGGSPTVTVTLGANDVLHKGRIVLAVCSGGASPVYGTVNTRQTGPGAKTVAVTINTTGLAAGNAFVACHSQAGSALFLIDKFHYLINTINAEPWLVLDTGLDYNNDSTVPPTDANDLIPVARDVEDLQIAYQLGRLNAAVGPDSNNDWVVGNQPGTQEEPSAAAVPPIAGTANGTMHPGNIRGVRVTLVLRTRLRDNTLRGTSAGDPGFTSENRNDVTAITVSNFHRYPQTFSVAIRNMTSPNPYLLF